MAIKKAGSLSSLSSVATPSSTNLSSTKMKDKNSYYQSKNFYEMQMARIVVEIVIFCMLFFVSACLMAGYPIFESFTHLFLDPLGNVDISDVGVKEDDESVSLKASVCKGNDNFEENADDASENLYNICFGLLRCDELHEEWVYMPELTKSTYAQQLIQYLMSTVAHNLREKHDNNDDSALQEMLRIPLTCDKVSFHPREIKQFEEKQKHYLQQQQYAEAQARTESDYEKISDINH